MRQWRSLHLLPRCPLRRACTLDIALSPIKIEKGQLCQKLTYSQQPTGGGRVLSVILAGTLAMGMTPAVALTTQSLEPMQAFADGTAITLEALTVAAPNPTTGIFDGKTYAIWPTNGQGNTYGDPFRAEQFPLTGLSATAEGQTSVDVQSGTVVLYTTAEGDNTEVALGSYLNVGSYGVAVKVGT